MLSYFCTNPKLFTGSKIQGSELPSARSCSAILCMDEPAVSRIYPGFPATLLLLNQITFGGLFFYGGGAMVYRPFF
ncbi:MAG: hypothetical protein B1H11_07475 [Desulfobacteraceae bacterium 4484_190.1]|nr:MAG: hypothetical protein B1H11_07475 [Desulfobacteraceae bacterium 4484_190.1]